MTLSKKKLKKQKLFLDELEVPMITRREIIEKMDNFKQSKNQVKT
jgi:hypothetical protein